VDESGAFRRQTGRLREGRSADGNADAHNAILSLVLAATLLTAGPAAAQPIPGMSEGQTMILIAVALTAVLAAIGAISSIRA
jgi:hypothetical protein